MAQLDCLEWEAGLTFRAFGITMGIRVNDASVLLSIPPYLPYGWQSVRQGVVERLYSLRVEYASGAIGSYALYRDEVECARSLDLEAVLESLEREIRWDLADSARGRIFVHAGAVGWRGQGIVLPGTSGVGKSTLVAKLVRAGARYYSDEYAVLDDRGRLHPFATQLHIREGGDQRQRRRSVESLGGRAGKRPLPVSLVVAAVYQPGGNSQLRRLTQAQGMLELMKNLAVRPRPRETLEALEQLTSRAQILQGERGEVEDFARYLLGVLEGRE
jgi:hypothetical protein